MAVSQTILHQVAFHETDAAGIVHFTNIFRYAELAEQALFRRLKLPWMAEDPSGETRGWPRVAAAARFLAPIQPDDEVTVILTVAKVGHTRVDMQFEVRLPGGATAALGEYTVAKARRLPGGNLKAIPLSDPEIRALQGS